MAEIVNTLVAVTDVETRIDTEGASYWCGSVTNRDVANTVYIGATGVTSAGATQGFRLGPLESLVINAPTTHRGWYAICAAGLTADLDRVAMAG